MKVTAVSSQSVTTLADVAASGLMRNTAGNSHARIDVIAVLPDTRHCVIKAAGLSITATNRSQTRSVGDELSARPTLRQTLHERGRRFFNIMGLTERRSSSAPSMILLLIPM